MKQIKSIALIGNPNVGKSTIFNQLTGLNQKIGNFPGITTDKKEGRLILEDRVYKLYDFPGTYSLYPHTLDESVVFEVLHDKTHAAHPDIILYIADSSNLERNLLLLTQIQDLKIPVIFILNMADVADAEGIEILEQKLSEMLGDVPILKMNARNRNLKKQLNETIKKFDFKEATPFIDMKQLLENNEPLIGLDYETICEHTIIVDHNKIKSSNPFSKEQREAIQKNDIELRFKKLKQMMAFCTNKVESKKMFSQFTSRLDKIATHPVFGALAFIVILGVLFQSIFAWATYPTDLIDSGFIFLGNFLKNLAPDNLLIKLLAEGVVPGIGGVAVFIPQIAILFGFLSILEESGIMARIVFLVDRVMRPFGLSGRSVVPLISGMACAIPAIQSTKSIEVWKERLITIFVTPLMSCSARLPVYTILIAFVIDPDQSVGIFNLQGLILLGLYLLGFAFALLSAYVMSKFIEGTRKSFLIMEMPLYKIPDFGNVFHTIYDSCRSFILEAGKVILAISILLWVLASYGPGNQMDDAAASITPPAVETKEALMIYEDEVAAARLSNSYIGHLGHFIEPIIRPLGYDWKIGVAIITSFAAREVFGGTMATIYSIGRNADDETRLIERMRKERDEQTGKPVYDFATAMSLLIFYVFAMMCMSTFAIVYKETKSLKWPLLQLIYMSALAFGSSYLVYQILS